MNVRIRMSALKVARPQAASEAPGESTERHRTAVNGTTPAAPPAVHGSVLRPPGDSATGKSSTARLNDSHILQQEPAAAGSRAGLTVGGQRDCAVTSDYFRFPTAGARGMSTQRDSRPAPERAPVDLYPAPILMPSTFSMDQLAELNVVLDVESDSIFARRAAAAAEARDAYLNALIAAGALGDDDDEDWTAAVMRWRGASSDPNSLHHRRDINALASLFSERR